MQNIKVKKVNRNLVELESNHKTFLEDKFMEDNWKSRWDEICRN